MSLNTINFNGPCNIIFNNSNNSSNHKAKLPDVSDKKAQPTGPKGLRRRRVGEVPRSSSISKYGISNRGMKKISQRKRRRIKRRNQEQEAHDKEKATQGKERRLSEALAQASNYLAEIDLPKTVDPDVVFVKRYFVAKGTRPEKTVETVEIDSDSDDDCYIDQDSTDDERPFSDDYSDDPDYCCVEGQIPVQPSVRPRRNR